MYCTVLARVAVPGVYPLIFPGPVHQGHLAWLSEVGCVGRQAHTSLSQGQKEGPIYIPDNIVINLPNGKNIYIGPHLTMPRSIKTIVTRNSEEEEVEEEQDEEEQEEEEEW